MEVDTRGVHIAHCCGVHGCKYGDEECGVAAGTLEQEHPCEYCDMDDRMSAPVVDQIVAWLEKRITELKAGADKADKEDRPGRAVALEIRAANYSDVVRGLREGAWKA